jgi:type VI secretion system protein ImpC
MLNALSAARNEVFAGGRPFQLISSLRGLIKMANEISLNSFDANLVATMEETDARPSADTAFRVALLGDWSGRSNRGLMTSGAELARWRPLAVDRDNLDEVMARLGVKLRLLIGGPGQSLTLDFSNLEDFHPDRIFERAELFQALRDTRERLSNSKTFAQAAEEVRQWVDRPTPEPKLQKQGSESSSTLVSGGSLLDQVLQMSDAGPATQTPADTISPDLRSLVQEAVRPYLMPDESEQDSLISAVDNAIGGQMRAILNDPHFQALEAAWRALDFLVSRLETGTQLKLYLLDISFEEMRAALMADTEIQTTGIYKLLVESTVETFGGDPWALLVGNYVFDFNAKDAELLMRLSTVAKAAVAPFVAAGTSRVVGCESLLTQEDPRDWKLASDADSELAWKELRRLPTARYLGLALPRFLLRLPYGKETETTEEFSFEEMPESPEDRHESYLWANPAFAVAYLLAQAYLESGWDLRPGEAQEIDGLPIYVYKVDDETRIKPCAEVLMTMIGAEKIIEHGPMPLITIKDTGTIRLGMFQSLARPATPLMGRWSD